MNRFNCAQFGSLVRLSFGEQYDEEITPTYRAAVMLELNTAKDLARILGEFVAGVEAAVAPTTLRDDFEAKTDPRSLAYTGALGQILSPKNGG